MEPYFIYKAVHMLSFTTWISGMIAMIALCIANQPLVAKHWRFVLIPAVLLTWVFGLLLAHEAHVFNEAWFHAKMTVVLLLTGLHGMLVASVRRAIAKNAACNLRQMRMVAWAVVVLVVSIIFLVVFKP